MNLEDKLRCLLQIHNNLLRAAEMPEHVRDYNIQSQVGDLNKQLVEISKQISAAQPTTTNDDIPF